MKSLRGQTLAVNEAAQYLEKGGPLTVPLRNAIRRLVAAAARQERETRDVLIGQDEGNG